jgi:putative hydrolase of the HAD superfamily
MTAPPRAILFDMDDTILSDTAAAAECWDVVCDEHACRIEGVPPARLLEEIHAYRRWYWSDPERHRVGRLDMDRARQEIVAEALRRVGVEAPETAWEIARAYSRHREARMQPFPGALETLAALRQRGVRLALLTNGSAAAQRRKIERHGLGPFFEGILIEGELGYGKPDERVYREALALLESTPADSWMVGDNLEWEVAVPQRLGLHAVWMDWAGAGLPPGTPVRPDRIITRLEELLEAPVHP